MNILGSIINHILALGAPVFVPMIMLIVGIIFKMKFRDAFSSALTLGIAFVGVGLVLGFMMDSIAPAATLFAKNTGIQLTTLDIGWAPIAAISWAWPYAFLMFPIQVVINIIMVSLKLTNTINVDLWNTWGKIFTAVLVVQISNSVPLALTIAAIQVVFELKNADLTQKQIQVMTGIPGVANPHPIGLMAVVLMPFDNLLRKIPFLNKEFDAETLKEKLGVFAENHIVGFGVGILLGLAARLSIPATLTLAVKTATTLLLFPMVTRLFLQALSPISDAVGTIMRKKFSGRELYIGLDWPFVAGRAEMWVVVVLLVPINILMAVILPGNTVLPIAGIINLCFIVPALIITGGNILRMFILGIISAPIFFYVSTFFGPYITTAAKALNVNVGAGAGQMVTYFGMEAPFFHFAMAYFSSIVNGNLLALLPISIWGVLWVYYVKTMKKREGIAAEKLMEG